jgi:hypothetical protein
VTLTVALGRVACTLKESGKRVDIREARRQAREISDYRMESEQYETSCSKNRVS